jgi:surface antigen
MTLLSRPRVSRSRLVVAGGAVGALTMPAGTEDGWGGFEPGECTSFAAFRVSSRDHVNMNALTRRAQDAYAAQHGGDRVLDAKAWGDAFGLVGIEVDRKPASGSVAWSNAGTYGHVAWVRQVSADGTMIIKDYNEVPSQPHQYHSWAGVPIAAFTGYLHFERGAATASATSVNAPPSSPTAASSKLAVTASRGNSTPLTVTSPKRASVQGGTGNPQSGGTNPQSGGTNPQGRTGSPQGGATTVQGPSTGGGSGGGSTPTPMQTTQADPTATQRQAPPQPVFTVMNTSESPPDGVWFRNSPNTSDTSRTTGLGVYSGEQVRLLCFRSGEVVGPYSDALWYRVDNVSRPTANGQSDSGWLNAHYINDGKAANEIDDGVPPC